MSYKFNKRNILISTYAFMFVFINYIGYIISTYNKLVYNQLPFVLLVSAGVGYAAPFSYDFVREKFDYIKLKEFSLDKYKKYWFLIFFALMFISFIPALLAYFPSIWTYDITTQVDQIINSGYTRYHPLLHTYLIDVCITAGKNIFGSYTYGALMYSLVQMVVMSLCVAYALTYVMSNFKMKKWMVILIAIFYLFMPFNAIMAISTTKDTIFAGLTLVLIVRLYDLFNNGYTKKSLVINLIILIMWFSFRNNAYFAFLALIIVGVALFWNKKGKILLCAGLIVITNIGFNAVLDKAFNAQTISTAELISVPGSQIARAAVNADDNITEDQWDEINVLFKESYHKYNPYLFDDVKLEMEFGVDKMVPLISLWAKLLPTCLVDYIDAFLSLNLGSWYILDESHARIYIDNYNDMVLDRGTLVDKHQGYLQTKNSDILDIEFKTYLPRVYKYYEDICSLNSLHAIYITRMLLAPGLYLWGILACLFYSIYKNNKKNIMWISLLVLYWMTSLLGPCTLFRYMYPIVFGLPVYLCLTFCKKKGEIIDGEEINQ